MTEVRQEIEPAAPEMPGILPAADGRGSPSSEKAPTSALLPPGLPDEPAQNLLQLRPPRTRLRYELRRRKLLRGAVTYRRFFVWSRLLKHFR